MKRIKYLLLFLVVIICLQINVNAATCPAEEFKRLKDLADKVELTQDHEWRIGYYENGEGYTFPSFTITAYNLNKDIKVMTERDYLAGDYNEFVDDGTGKGVLYRFSGGAKVNVVIRAYTADGCSGKLLTTKTMKLPTLNFFSYEDVCFENREFKYCSLFLDEKISSEFFTRELNKYLEEKKNNSQNEKRNEKEEKNSNVKNVLLISGVVVVLVIIVISVILIKRKRKNSL